MVLSQIKVLGRCRHNELPFEINRSREGGRDPAAALPLSGSAQPGDQTEHRAALQRGGRFAQSHDGTRFSEITTPDSDRFLPEGARDYLVPARSIRGCFTRCPGAAAV